MEYTPTRTEDETDNIDDFDTGKDIKIAFVHFNVKHYFKDDKSQDNYYKVYD